MNHKLPFKVGLLTFAISIMLLLYLNFVKSAVKDIYESHLWSSGDDKKYIINPLNTETPKPRLPNAIIAGCAKCGTRALLWMLSLHPDIKHAGPEIHFFDRDENYRKGLDWYQNHFPPRLEHQIGIEKSPAYFVVEGVPKRIHDMNSSMKIIVIVCEPVKKTISRFAQIYERSGNKLSFEKWVMGEHKDTIDPNKNSVREGMYSKHLQNWLRWFPLEQILFLDGDHFKVDPLSQIRQVEKFLNLPPYIDESLIVYNKTKGFYCVAGKEMVCLGGDKGRPHPTIDPVVKQKLADLFAPINKDFLNSVDKLFNWNVWN